MSDNGSTPHLEGGKSLDFGLTRVNPQKSRTFHLSLKAERLTERAKECSMHSDDSGQ